MRMRMRGNRHWPGGAAVGVQSCSAALVDRAAMLASQLEWAWGELGMRSGLTAERDGSSTLRRMVQGASI